MGITAFAGSSFLAYEVTQAAAPFLGHPRCGHAVASRHVLEPHQLGQAGMAALSGVTGMVLGAGFKGLQLAATAITTRFAAACLPVNFGIKAWFTKMSRRRH